MTSSEFFGNKTRLAVLLFLASEGIFFAFLITGYVFYHGAVKNGPDAHNSLDVLKTGIYTIILLSSSATIYMAERALKRKQKGFSFWMGITVVCGLVFLFGEMREYMRLLQQNVTISRNLFGSTYYTVTGFHAAHVTIGIILMGILLLLSFRGGIKEKDHIGVEVISYYWHFVDVVWVAVFSVIYLWSTR
ncbi:MAG: cytochrome c oxidase subunit 3 [Acidobacteriaceae bacterium]